MLIVEKLDNKTMLVTNGDDKRKFTYTDGINEDKMYVMAVAEYFGVADKKFSFRMMKKLRKLLSKFE